MNQKLENNDSPLGKGNKYTSFSLEPLFHPQLIIHELTLEVEIILTKIDDYSFGCSSWQILNLYKKSGKQFLQKEEIQSGCFLWSVLPPCLFIVTILKVKY